MPKDYGELDFNSAMKDFIGELKKAKEDLNRESDSVGEVVGDNISDGIDYSVRKIKASSIKLSGTFKNLRESLNKQVQMLTSEINGKKFNVKIDFSNIDVNSEDIKRKISSIISSFKENDIIEFDAKGSEKQFENLISLYVKYEEKLKTLQTQKAFGSNKEAIENMKEQIVLASKMKEIFSFLNNSTDAALPFMMGRRRLDSIINSATESLERFNAVKEEASKTKVNVGDFGNIEETLNDLKSTIEGIKTALEPISEIFKNEGAAMQNMAQNGTSSFNTLSEAVNALYNNLLNVEREVDNISKKDFNITHVSQTIQKGDDSKSQAKLSLYQQKATELLKVVERLNNEQTQVGNVNNKVWQNAINQFGGISSFMTKVEKFDLTSLTGKISGATTLSAIKNLIGQITLYKDTFLSVVNEINNVAPNTIDTSFLSGLDDIDKRIEELEKTKVITDEVQKSSDTAAKSMASSDLSSSIEQLTKIGDALTEIKNIIEPLSKAFTTEGTLFNQMSTSGALSMDTLIEKLQEALKLSAQLASENVHVVPTTVESKKQNAYIVEDSGQVGFDFNSVGEIQETKDSTAAINKEGEALIGVGEAAEVAAAKKNKFAEANREVADSGNKTAEAVAHAADAVKAEGDAAKQAAQSVAETSKQLDKVTSTFMGNEDEPVKKVKQWSEATKKAYRITKETLFRNDDGRFDVISTDVTDNFEKMRQAAEKAEQAALKAVKAQDSYISQKNKNISALSSALDPNANRTLIGTEYEEEARKKIEAIQGELSKLDSKLEDGSRVIFSEEELNVEKKKIEELIRTAGEYIRTSRNAEYAPIAFDSQSVSGNVRERQNTLNLFINNLRQAGVLTGELKADTDRLSDALNAVKTNGDLKNYLYQLKEVQSKSKLIIQQKKEEDAMWAEYNKGRTDEDIQRQTEAAWAEYARQNAAAAKEEAAAERELAQARKEADAYYQQQETESKKQESLTLDIERQITLIGKQEAQWKKNGQLTNEVHQKVEDLSNALLKVSNSSELAAWRKQWMMLKDEVMTTKYEIESIQKAQSKSEISSQKYWDSAFKDSLAGLVTPEKRPELEQLKAYMLQQADQTKEAVVERYDAIMTIISNKNATMQKLMSAKGENEKSYWQDQYSSWFGAWEALDKESTKAFFEDSGNAALIGAKGIEAFNNQLELSNVLSGKQKDTQINELYDLYKKQAESVAKQDKYTSQLDSSFIGEQQKKLIQERLDAEKETEKKIQEQIEKYGELYKEADRLAVIEEKRKETARQIQEEAAKQADKEAERARKQAENYGKSTYNSVTRKYDNTVASFENLDDGVASKSLLDAMDDYKRKYDELTAARQRFIDNPALANDQSEKNAFNGVAQSVETARKKVQLYIDDMQKLKQVEDEGLLKGKTKQFDPNGVDSQADAIKKYAAALYDGKLQVTGWNAAGNEMYGTLDRGKGVIENVTVALDRGTNTLYSYGKGTKEVGTLWQQLTSSIGKKAKEISAFLIGGGSIYKAIAEVRKGIQYVKEIDSALTELKKVTDETDKAYAQFLQTMSKTGTEVGATVSDLTNMAANWARLGYSMEEAGNLAKSTAVLLNVSEFTNAEDASEALISTIQAYGYAAEDSMHVVDVLNEIGNNFAVSSDGLATALQDSASALMSAGNNLEQSVAMVAAANKVLQDPGQVGSALRTISLRIRGTSVKVLEEMGEETDGVIESVSKLQAKIKGLTGVNILNDAGGYKDTYTIIKEIAEVWPELDDMNKAATLELLAGKNRSNAMAAMLTNIEDLTAAYEDAMDAEGSAMSENEKYLDSIQGRIDQFTNAVQTMWNNALGSNIIKMIVSLGTELIKLVDTLGLIPSALAAIAAVKFVKNIGISAVKESITAIKQVFDAARGAVSTLSSFSGEGLVGFLNGKIESASIDNVTKSIGAEIIARKELNKELAKDILLKNGVKEEDLEGALAAMGYSGANGVLSLSFKKLALSIKQAALAFIKSPFGIAVASVAGIALIVGAVDLLTESFDEAKDKLDEAKEEIETNEQELKSLNSELEETKERIDELNSKDKLTVVEEEELKKLKEQNAQLKTQIGILEERDKYLKSEAAEKARNLYSKDKRVQGSNQSNMPTYAAGAGATGSLVGSTFVTDPNIPQVAAVSGTSTTGENYIKSQLMLQVDNYKKAQKKYQEAIDAANKDSNDQNMKNMETARKNLEDAGSKLNETMQGVANDYADIEWNDSTKEFLKPIYDQLDQARIAVDTSGEAILTAFNRIASQSDFENEVKSIEETAGLTGEALQEMLSFNDDGTLDTAAGSMNLFVQSLIDCGVISDTSAESLQKVVDLTLMTSENTSDAAVANQKLARSQKMLQYYKLYKELNQYSKQLKNVGNNNKELSDQYKEQISLIRQKMSALAQEISQYDILGEQINEAKSSFEEFENAQTTDEDNTYVDKTSEMFKTLIDGFQTTNVGSEAFKSAFKSLIPKEVYDAPDTLVEKYDAAAKYISETLSKYFKIEYDDDGIIESVEVTSANINKFAEDARDKGLIELSDDGVWTVLETDFKKFAEQMGITEEMLVAIGTQMDKMDADWIMGDTTSFFDSFDMDAQTNIYRAVKNLALLEAQMEDGMVKTDEEKEAWAKSYAEYTKIISDNSKEAVASIEEYNAATAKVDEASAKVDEAKAKLEALKNSGASETEIKIAEGDLTTLVEDLTSALAKKNELTAPDEMLITIAQDYLTGQLDTLQTQLLTREWFITPTIKDDGTIESDLFELGEDGKYKIKSGVEIPDEDKALVEQYIEVLNGIKTVSVFFKDENDAQGKADKLQTTTENIDEILNSLKAQIDVSDAISALEELKTEIDSLKNIKVNVTTEKKTGFWDWLTGGSNHVNTTPQRNTSNGRQNIKLQGTANATGDWGLSQDERNSLVGELGQELVVDPKTGKYYTVGDNGAEFVDLPKDAIIFNHKQTAEIFKNGHINTRGQAYAEGNAHVGTSGTFLTKYGLAAAYGGSVPNYQGYSDVLQHLDTISDTVDDASSDSKDDFEELFDWFEVLVNELDQSIDLITAKIDNTVGASGKNALYQQVVDLNYAKMAALNKGIELYSGKAQEFLNRIPQAYKEMAQNGAVALTDFQGEANEKVVEAIKNYREMKDKVADLNVELENVKKNISDINVQMLETISTEYENKIGLITNLNDRIQKAMDLQEESGERLSANYYNEMIKNAQEALKLQKQQRQEMQAQLDQSVASGDVERYSENWYKMVNDINTVDEAIVQSEIDIESFQNAINDLHWENFERLIKSIENVSDEAEHLRNLIKDDDLTDDVGNWTEAGITALGLASQEMENAKYRAELYGKEIEQLKKDYKAGLYSQDEYNDKLQELKSSQWDCIDAYESAKDAIVDLNKTRIEAVKDGIQKEIDAYEKLIDKRKEDLDAQKDQHDWAKTVKEHTSEIDSIQRQIDALNGDTSASAAAQRKKLQEELANAQQELEETYYDREIEMQQKALDETLELYKEDKEKKMEELDEYLKHEEQVIADSYELVLSNSEVVYTKLNEMAKEYNIEILNSVVDPWNQGTTALGTYGESLELATSGYVAQLKLIEDELNNIQNQADATARSLIAMANAQSSQIINSGTSSKPSSSGKTSTPASKPSSTTSGKPSVGQTVTVKTSATNWSRDGGNGTRIASFVKGNSYTVKQVSGNEVLIGTSSGYTGWINKKDLIGYAKGTTGVKKNGPAVIDENGLEEIVMHTKGGKVAYLTKGTSVLPHDISENLMKLGSIDYRALLDRNKPKVGAPYVVNNDIELNLNVGEVIHVEHMDNDSLPEIQDAIQKQLDSYIKRMNNGVRKYAR